MKYWALGSTSLSNRYKVLSELQPLILVLSAQFFIYRVTNWPSLSGILYSFILLQSPSVRTLERERLEGSLPKFGCSVGFERFVNVPDSEGTVRVGFLMM